MSVCWLLRLIIWEACSTKRYDTAGRIAAGCFPPPRLNGLSSQQRRRHGGVWRGIRRRAANEGRDDVQRTTPGQQRRWRWRAEGHAVRLRAAACSKQGRRQRAANDGGDDAQQTTPGRQRRWRWRAETTAAWRGHAVAAGGGGGEAVASCHVRMERDISFIFSFVSANCRRHEMLKP